MYEKIRKIVNTIENKWWIFIILLVIIMTLSVSVRLEPLPNLIDSTTGRPMPSALDPFYFMRVSEYIIDGGDVSDTDPLRYLGNTEYSKELLPQANVFLFNVIKMFDNDIDFRYVNVISPVIYFALSILVFYFLMIRLTGSRYASIISTACLAFAPTFLRRTTAGFSDHEAIGVLFFFIALYFMMDFVFGSVKKQPPWVKNVRMYVLFPLAIVLTIYSWGGISKLLLIIYPLTFFLFNVRSILARRERGGSIKDEYVDLHKFIISFLIINVLMFLISFVGFSYSRFLNSYILSYTGVGLLFMVVYYIITMSIYSLPFIKDTMKSVWAFGITCILALIGLIYTDKIASIILALQSPLLKSRIGQTVAENQAISLINLSDHAGVFFFFMFIVASVMIFYPFITNFIDLYFKKKNNLGFIARSNYFYLSILIVALYSFNSSIRMMFINSIFLSIFTGIVIGKIFEAYYSDYKGDEPSLYNMYRTLVVSIIMLLIFSSLFSIFSFYTMSVIQTKNIGPSANPNWQNAMKWVRENTQKDSLFIHWWDYGYWIQTLGERPTVTDGGHSTTYWDHLIGRYLLTTPEERSAFEMMNTYGVNYFLIDPSDISKYSAYSSIGDDKPDTDDRTSMVGQFLKNPQRTIETNNSTTFVYSGQMVFDEDYTYDGKFFPKSESGIVQLEITFNNDGTLSNVFGVAGDTNGFPVKIPIRYFHFNEQTFDMGDGYEGVVKIVGSYQNGQIDPYGGMLLLTPKVSKSFFARTYILGQYDNSSLMNIAYQGPKYGGDNKFLFANNRLLAPITIYEINQNPYGINPGFLEWNGEYSAFDEMYYDREDL